MEKSYLDQDLQFASLLQGGDEFAYAEIFKRYNSLLYTFAFKRIRDEDEAKDIVQDVFLKLWQNRESLVLHTSLSSYLYRAVLNQLLNRLKHITLHQDHIESFQIFMNDKSLQTDYRIREKDMQALIQLEVAALPPRMREVFTLRSQEGLSNREIAEQLGLSEQTIETHMKRALKVLRSRLSIAITLLSVMY